VIRTIGLAKRYGQAAALDGVDLEVPAGVVYGLIGPNGAGKTTLLSVLAGLRRPDSGQISIAADRSRIAVLPDSPRFDPWLTAWEVLALAARLAGPSARDDLDAVLAEAGLAEAAGRRVGGFSRGMLQRLGLAATVVGQPEVLLLDEPAAALDPEGRREVLDLVQRLRGSATVVFSSHILGDVEEVSDWVGILDRGRLRFQGPVADLLRDRDRSGLWFRIRARVGIEVVEAELRLRPWVADLVRSGSHDLRVRVTSMEEAEKGLMVAIAASGAGVTMVQPEAVTLEDVFLETTR
jgi:ABC-2 type transport system ATP-binding protein